MKIMAYSDLINGLILASLTIKYFSGTGLQIALCFIFLTWIYSSVPFTIKMRIMRKNGGLNE